MHTLMINSIDSVALFGLSVVSHNQEELKAMQRFNKEPDII